MVVLIKVTGFFRRLFCLLLVSLLLVPAALADKVDVSSMSDDEIVDSCEKRAPALNLANRHSEIQLT